MLALAFGPRGELSHDFYRLIDVLAESAAEKKWRSMLAPNATVAKGVFKAWFTRSIGLAAIRANAAELEKRLNEILGNGSEASKNRHNARSDWHEARNEYARYYGSGDLKGKGRFQRATRH